MRAFVAGLCLAALAFGASAARDPLAAQRWRSRILVVSAPSAEDAGLKAQRIALGPVRDGLAERQLVVMEAVGPGPEAVTLRKRLNLPPDAFRAVLIGKDGGVKLVSEEPIPPQTLFATIDAMPMRKDEMRSRQRGARSGDGAPRDTNG